MAQIRSSSAISSRKDARASPDPNSLLEAKFFSTLGVHSSILLRIVHQSEQLTLSLLFGYTSNPKILSPSQANHSTHIASKVPVDKFSAPGLVNSADAWKAVARSQLEIHRRSRLEIYAVTRCNKEVLAAFWAALFPDNCGYSLFRYMSLSGLHHSRSWLEAPTPQSVGRPRP
jgi:hypothetical protein